MNSLVTKMHVQYMYHMTRVGSRHQVFCFKTTYKNEEMHTCNNYTEHNLITVEKPIFNK